MHIELPDTVDCGDIAGMLAARDGLLVLWRRGVIDEDLVRIQLRSLAAIDADGATWRLRPTEQGVLFIKIARDGSAQTAHPEDFVVRRKSLLGNKWAVSIFVVLWLLAASVFFLS